MEEQSATTLMDPSQPSERPPIEADPISPRGIAPTRRRALLYALLVLLLVVPELLSFISAKDNVGGWSLLRPLDWIAWVLIAVLFVQGIRGTTSSLTVLAVFSLIPSAAALIMSFFVQNGPFPLAAAGLVGIATAIVLILLRDDVAASNAARGSEASTVGRPGWS